jgi:hypothetical protein
VTAVYILNRAPTHGLEGRTPYEVWYRKKPSVHHLHSFGCIAYVKDIRTHLAKLDAHRKRWCFLAVKQGARHTVSSIWWRTEFLSRVTSRLLKLGEQCPGGASRGSIHGGIPGH